MELRICFLLLLVGCVAIAEEKTRRPFHPLQVNDAVAAKKQNSHDEKLTEEATEKKVQLEDDPPRFFSETFNSTITGKKMMTLHNREIYAFQGFRYGVGERFKPPKEVGNFWNTDNFDAIHIGFKCPQSATIGRQAAGNEDCLYINVYTPVLPSGNNELLPVMHFIHGGGFIFGDSTTYMPTRLLDHNVILVTIHYRMGAFGFFTLNNEEAPGNIAIYDMIESLRWTNKYIKDFGGDPGRVTVMGESAGSVSANFMMLVEPAADLINAVISESGSCLDPWSLDKDPISAAHLNAEYVGCPTDDDVTLLKCMQEVPFEKLVEAQGHLSSTDQHNGLDGFRGLSPTIQNFEISEDAGYELIFTQPAKDYFTQNKYNKVPFMTGANKQEGSLIASISYINYLVYNNLDKNETYMREMMIQDILGSIGLIEESHSLATTLQKLYCPDVDLANATESIPCIIDLAGVLFLKAGSWQVANYHSYYSPEQPTFYYSFEFESDDSLSAAYPFDGGVTHADELFYLFSLPAIMDKENGQLATEERMTKLWTNFATYHNPTPDNQLDELAEMGIPKWTPFKFEDHHVMVIADKLIIDTEFSNRWTITLDELRPNCTGLCVDYRDQRDEYKTKRDAALKEKERVEKERNDAVEERNDYEEQRNEAVAEREEVKKERNKNKEEMYENIDYLTQYRKDSEYYKDQKMPYEISMIVFIALTVIASGVAVFFIFKARR